MDRMVAVTQQFATFLEGEPDFEIATFPQSNILCFRYGSAGEKRPNEFQEEIRNRLLQSQKFYIVKTQLGEDIYLRCTVINPNTRIEHLYKLADEIRSIAMAI